MMKPKSERWIAISVVLSSILLVLALSLAIGKFSLGNPNRKIRIRFESVTGVNPNTAVKFAGAPVGRVTDIRVLSPEEQGKERYFIEIAVDVDAKLRLGDDLKATIKQDGLLGPKFIALTPGAPDAKDLPKDAIILASNPVELGDLAGPGMELLTKLQPVAANLEGITAQLNQNLPEILARLEGVLQNGDEILATVSTPEGKARIEKLLANLKVVSDNLKVISTNAKAMTATLGEKPWRMIWGGETNRLPTEEEILASDVAIPIQRPVPEKEAPEKPVKRR